MIPQHQSKTTEHPTPACVVEPARELMGGFDLDPASTKAFNQTIKARRFYDRQRDGLAQPWSGRVFLNPPGGKVRWTSGRWVPATGGASSSMLVWWERLVGFWAAGEVTEAVFVGFTLEILRTSQASPVPVQRFVRCYPRDRLAFSGDDPTHANVLVYLPPRREAPSESLGRFRRCFDSLGLCEGGSGG